jgi:hypothetical protein
VPFCSKNHLDGKVPDGHKIERLYDKPGLKHVVLRPLPDRLQTSKEEVDLINKAGELGCKHGTGCEKGTDRPSPIRTNLRTQQPSSESITQELSGIGMLFARIHATASPHTTSNSQDGRMKAAIAS